MESNFNNPFAPDSPEKAGATEGSASEAPQTEPAPTADVSPGFARFRTCRWQQPAENGTSEFCTHREVKPYAGTNNFDADAWCPDCAHYKLRRVPKKRSPDDYAY